MAKIKAGVIGAGIGTYHIEAYQAHEDSEVVALCDLNEELLAETGEDYEIEKLFTDYEDMLELELDCVSVCVPNKFHAPITIDCLKAEKNVLCEKPLARTAKEGQKMVDAAEDAGLTLMVQFNNRFRPEAQVLKGHVDDGTFGDIYFARCGWIRRNGIPGWGGWFTQKEIAGGGPLIDLAVHMLDLTLWLMGNPEPEMCMASTYSVFGPEMEALGPWGTPDPKGTFDVEDMAVGMLKFADGQTVMLEASWASRIKREWVYSTLCGTEAGASLERVFAIDGVDETAIDTLELYTQEQGEAVDRVVKLEPDEAMGRHTAVEHFVDCLVEGQEPISPATDGLRIMKILDAMYKSADQGKAVKIR
ncbi:MAG: Gfo/Idh/MocA family oxidoreductase [Armatimonadota bacterium]|nr:Gfo/Idh/MocA family oxidoreductase [Armatimonadota bacterium]